MSLKAGTVGNFSGSLAEAIESAMKAEFLSVKKVAMPDGDIDDRRILFVAIARGVLGYLNAHSGDAVASISLDLAGGATPFTVDSIDFDVVL